MSFPSYNYYTPQMLAELLITLIPDKNIKTVIDICCGQGDLLKAAHTVFPDALLFGIDIKDDKFYKSFDGCSFFNEDAFIFVEGCKKKYDLILSNPPFGQANISNDQCVIKELNRKRLECQMLDSNLKLMHNNSWLLAILPATFITGSSYRNVRKAICNKYCLHSVVFLPDDTFGSHLIKTFAVILSEKYLKKDVSMYCARHNASKWSLYNIEKLSSNDVKSGRWWREASFDVTKVKVEIFRGKICSKDFRNSGIPVYHNAAKKDGIWHPSIRYVEKVNKGEKYARIGDVIINRVGHATGYWWINTENEYAVTDCILVLRGIADIKKVIEKISTEGRLNIPLRGVASQFITKEDVLNKIASVWEDFYDDKVFY